MVTRTIEVEMVPGPKCPVVRLSQGDENYTIFVHLVNSDERVEFTIADGASAKLQGTLRGGVKYEKAVERVGDMIIIPGDAGMTAIDGRGVFEIALNNGGKITNSSNFVIDIEKAALAE